MDTETKNKIYEELLKKLNDLKEEYKEKGLFINVEDMLVNENRKRVNKTLSISKDTLVLKLDLKDLNQNIENLNNVLSKLGEKEDKGE